jgi:hypothetical protein
LSSGCTFAEALALSGRHVGADGDIDITEGGRGPSRTAPD